MRPLDPFEALCVFLIIALGTGVFVVSETPRASAQAPVVSPYDAEALRRHTRAMEAHSRALGDHTRALREATRACR